MVKMNSLFLIIMFFYITYGCNISKPKSKLLDNSKTNIVKTQKLSISQTLKENSHLSVERRISLYKKLKAESPKKYNFENEDEFTMYGYSLLWDNNIEEALAIFKLIVSEFPNSSNPYDSLGEAYMKSGNIELAIANYTKSREMNPDNFNAEDQIERMKYPNKIPKTPAEKFAKVYTIQEYKDDLDQLGKKLIDIHPQALKFISKNDFWNLIKNKKALITENTTYSKFIWHCSEIIASINCSHTSMGNFSLENEMLPIALRFPLQTRWVNNQLFVIDALNNKNRVAIKDEIVSINGMSVSKIVAGIYKHISSQGYVKTSKKHFFNSWATGLIPFALNFPETYKISLKGKENPIVLNKAITFKDPIFDKSVDYCKDNLCLQFLNGNKKAVLTVNSFNYYPWNNLSVFENFMDSSFKKINEKGIENLIIDLRFNHGGSPESSIHLLKYLLDKPFSYFYSNNQYPKEKETHKPFENAFKGKLYFIIDGNGKSTTGHFMSIVKDLKLGTIVGEELGSNQFCTAGQTIRRLSNTKLVFYIANAASKTTVTSLLDEVGILPNYYVTQSIDDYLNNIDTVKDFTINLIEK